MPPRSDRPPPGPHGAPAQSRPAPTWRLWAASLLLLVGVLLVLYALITA